MSSVLFRLSCVLNAHEKEREHEFLVTDFRRKICVLFSFLFVANFRDMHVTS